MKKVIFYPINLIYSFLFRLALPPKSDTREELTALKALDKLLRTYDRRSTPTNDLGMYSSGFLRKPQNFDYISMLIWPLHSWPWKICRTKPEYCTMQQDVLMHVLESYFYINYRLKYEQSVYSIYQMRLGHNLSQQTI